MKYTQKEKQKRGADFEHEFRKSCNVIKCWVYKMFSSLAGTPFDFIVLTDLYKYGIELKRIKGRRLNYSLIRQNQRSGLTKFECVNNNISLILVNVKNDTENRLFLLPWRKICDDITSGSRGSIDVQKYFEIKRAHGVWDLSCLLEGVVE